MYGLTLRPETDAEETKDTPLERSRHPGSLAAAVHPRLPWVFWQAPPTRIFLSRTELTSRAIAYGGVLEGQRSTNLLNSLV